MMTNLSSQNAAHYPRVFLITLRAWIAGLALFVFAALPCAAQGIIEVKSDNFTLAGQMDGQTGTDLISELERFRAALMEVHNIPATAPDQHVSIFVVSDPEVFKVLNLAKEFVAVYQTTPAGPRVLINGNEVANDLDYLSHSLRHEYVHHFNRAHLRREFPVWYEEGLAEYYAGYGELADGQYEFGRPLEFRTFLLTFPLEGWYPLKDQLLSFGKIRRANLRFILPDGWAKSPDQASLFYAQSWALVHYQLNQEGGRNKLDQLVEAIISIQVPPGQTYTTYEEYKKMVENEGDYIAEAIENVLGVASADFQKTLQDYVAAPQIPTVQYTPGPERTVPQIKLRDLSKAQAAAAQYRLLSLTSAQATINAKMKALRELAAQDPDLSVSLQISDAAQQYILGANAYARERMDAALALDPHAPDAPLLNFEIQYADFINRNMQNGEGIRAHIRPLLAKYPDDPTLLFKMAASGIKDTGAIPGDVYRAMQKIKAENIAQRNPRAAMPMISFYLEREELEPALALAKRAKLFQPDYNLALTGLISEIESELRRSAEETQP